MTAVTAPAPADDEKVAIAPVKQSAIALERILATKPEVFISFVGQPTILLPVSPERPGSNTWSLRSDRVKAWIAEFTWEQSRIVLAEREIDRIITVLVGKAWHDQRNSVELKEAMDQDPLLDALVIFMHENAIFDKNCTALRSSLENVAKSAGIDMKDRLWPKGAPHLSRRIGELKNLLQTAGVIVEIGRRGNGVRFVKLSRQNPSGGDAKGSPPSPSIDNFHHPKEMRRHDDGDSVLRRKLFERLSASNTETNDEGH